jgi:hypothetical protein
MRSFIELDNLYLIPGLLLYIPLKGAEDTEMTAEKAEQAAINPETFQGWGKLEPSEQEAVKKETQSLDDSRRMESVSKLQVGEHLSKLQKVLEPKRLFISFLDEVFGMSRATAYRYMEMYQTAKGHMPAPVLEIAIERGSKIDPEILKKSTPPQTTDRTAIQKYLETLRPVRATSEAKTPDLLLKECFNFVASRWAMLPNNMKTRTAFMRSLFGMLLAKFGVATPQSFVPEAAPQTFHKKRGRPLKAIEAKAA